MLPLWIVGPRPNAYDAVDNLQTQTDNRGVVTTFAYDALNRLTQKSYNDAPLTYHLSPVSYTYDDSTYQTQQFAKGKLTDVTETSDSSRFTYDNQGRLIEERKTLSSTPYTIYRTYDLLGRLTTLTYPDTSVATYTYNLQGGLETISLWSPVSGLLSLVSNVDYNAAGQILKIAYGNGVVSDYTYNPLTLRLSRLTTLTSNLTPLQDYTYAFDPIGNVQSITGWVASYGGGTHSVNQSFGYDDLNRLTSASGNYGNFSYAYDPIGNMLSKEGVTMSYGLPNGTKPHAVTSVTEPRGTFDLTYDANGNMTRKGSPVSPLLDQLLSYDAENRLTRVDTPQTRTVTVTFQRGWNFFSLPVIPDELSIASIFPNVGLEPTDEFEQLSRFEPTTRTYTHYVDNATFDDFSQLEYGVGYQTYCKASAPVTVSLTGRLPTSRRAIELPAGWHLLPAITTDGSLTVGQVFAGIAIAPSQILRYDPAVPPSGSLISVQASDPARTGEAYYVQVLGQNPSTWTPPLPQDVTTRVTYDGDGGRVKQTTASGTTTYLGESYEIAPDGVVTKYVFAGSQRIAAVAQSPQPGAPSVLRYYHTDHLGSSNVVTEGSGPNAGQVIQQLDYTPYGSVHSNTGSVNVPHQFTGQRQDAANGLILFPARAYDPSLGRFLQPDPFVQDPTDPQSLNRYSYVRNNPLRFVDPSGYFLLELLAFIIIAAIVVSVVASVASFIAAETGHYRAAQRFAKVARVSAQVATYAYWALIIATAAGAGGGGPNPGALAFAAANEEGGGDDGAGSALKGPIQVATALADAATKHANRGADRERAKQQLQEFGLSPKVAEVEAAQIAQQAPNGFPQRYLLHINVKRGATGLAQAQDPGHAWLTLEGPEGVTSYGYWPDGLSVRSGFMDRGMLTPDISRTYVLSREQYGNVVQYVNNVRTQTAAGKMNWSLSMNCTDFVLGGARSAGIPVPDMTTRIYGKAFSDPNKLADWLTNKQ